MMSKLNAASKQPPVESVELITDLPPADLNDLCDATELSIKAGGGFGWVEVPHRDALERYWEGVVVMPSRLLFVMRLDGVICGSCQLVLPPHNNQAQAHSAQLTTHFVAPWARGYRLSDKVLELIETTAKDRGIEVLNGDMRETMTSAMALYEKHGFQKIGEHPYYAKVNGIFVKGVYYCKSLHG